MFALKQTGPSINALITRSYCLSVIKNEMILVHTLCSSVFRYTFVINDMLVLDIYLFKNTL